MSPGVGYDDYAESPVHRFYQMWQQLDCTATAGCQNHRMGRRIDIEPNNISELVGKAGVARALKVRSRCGCSWYLRGSVCPGRRRQLYSC